MKTIKYLTLRLMAVAAIAIAFALPAKAQVTPFTYFNVDWQFNAPISNNFANKASGWGMNFEGGYYVLPDLSIGAFINYHTNNEYISRQTLPISNSAAQTTFNPNVSKGILDARQLMGDVITSSPYCKSNAVSAT